jgi:hypothetical protein
MVNSVWHDNALARASLSEYHNIHALLDAIPNDGTASTKAMGEKLKAAITEGAVFGVNETTAKALDAALADPAARDAVVKIAHDNPQQLNDALDRIKADPTHTKDIMATLSQPAAAPPKPAVAKPEEKKPEVAAAKPADDKKAPGKKAAEAKKDDKDDSFRPLSETQEKDLNGTFLKSFWEKVKNADKKEQKSYGLLLLGLKKVLDELGLGDLMKDFMPSNGKKQEAQVAEKDNKNAPAAPKVAEAAKPAEAKVEKTPPTLATGFMSDPHGTGEPKKPAPSTAPAPATPAITMNTRTPAAKSFTA